MEKGAISLDEFDALVGRATVALHGEVLLAEIKDLVRRAVLGLEEKAAVVDPANAPVEMADVQFTTERLPDDVNSFGQVGDDDSRVVEQKVTIEDREPVSKEYEPDPFATFGGEPLPYTQMRGREPQGETFGYEPAAERDPAWDTMF